MYLCPASPPGHQVEALGRVDARAGKLGQVEDPVAQGPSILRRNQDRASLPPTYMGRCHFVSVCFSQCEAAILGNFKCTILFQSMFQSNKLSFPETSDVPFCFSSHFTLKNTHFVKLHKDGDGWCVKRCCSQKHACTHSEKCEIESATEQSGTVCFSPHPYTTVAGTGQGVMNKAVDLSVGRRNEGMREAGLVSHHPSLLVICGK